MDCRTTTCPGGVEVRVWVASHAYTSSKRSQVDVRMYTSLEWISAGMDCRTTTCPG